MPTGPKSQGAANSGKDHGVKVELLFEDALPLNSFLCNSYSVKLSNLITFLIAMGSNLSHLNTA